MKIETRHTVETVGKQFRAQMPFLDPLQDFRAAMQGRLISIVAFDRHITEARLALGKIAASEMPALAWDALEAGFDGPRTRRMAALSNPSGWEVDQILPAFMAETGLNTIAPPEAALRMARELAHHVLSAKLDPLKYTKDFEWLWIQTGYPRELQDAGMLDDQKYVDIECMGEAEADFREYARSVLLALLAAPEQSSNG